VDSIRGGDYFVMPYDAHKNFAYSTVATAPSPATTGTSLVVPSGDGSKFPTPPFNATVWPTAANPLTTNAEIIRCTAIVTDTLTIARAQEGSTARSIVTGDQIAATITAKTLTDLETTLISYEGDWSAPTTYTDGDVIVYNGVAYLCVAGPTTVTPDPTLWGAAQISKPTYGTTLPGSPVDGQEAILVDSTTNPTYQWRFRYNVGSTSPYKWEFVGGTDAYAEVNTAETTSASTTWLDLATVGPRIIVPRAGDYDALVGCDGSASAQNVWMLIGISVGATAPVVPLGRLMYAPTLSGYPQHFGTSRRALGVAAGNDLRLRYQSYHSGSSTTFDQRWIRVTPVRVS
jgi:hypothetical protein